MSGADNGSGRDIGLISVSLDLGAGRRGVDMGPSAIRIAGLKDEVQSLGHRIREIGTVTASAPELATEGDRAAKYLEEVHEVCLRTRDRVQESLAHDALPLILGGDHSITIGSGAGVARHFRSKGERIGVIWVDAHTDMNTPETSPSGNIHGMSLAVLLGRGSPELTDLCGDGPAVLPQNVSVVGARSIDPTEAPWVRESGIRVYTMTEVDERGIAEVIAEAIARASDGTAGMHVSFDLDVIDPQVAPGVGTPVRGGLTYREAHLICEKSARSGALLSMDMVELNPVLDLENRTARLAVGLVASALGKSIL